jgi:MYXO-CTERM domain-containing protein
MTQLTRSLALSLALVSGSASLAAAFPTYEETVIHDTTTAVEIKLDATTVLCSAADYGALYLKVGMPELAKLTLLDHQNIGANAPCVAAGVCTTGNQPEDIIDPTKPTEVVQINVKAIRLDEADQAAQTCNTMLIERVNVTIRGVDFTHQREADLGSRRFEDCAVPGATGTGSGSGSGTASGSGDGKTDGQAPQVEAPSAGCSATTGGAGPAALVLALGAVLVPVRRRRRR